MFDNVSKKKNAGRRGAARRTQRKPGRLESDSLPAPVSVPTPPVVPTVPPVHVVHDNTVPGGFRMEPVVTG